MQLSKGIDFLFVSIIEKGNFLVTITTHEHAEQAIT